MLMMSAQIRKTKRTLRSLVDMVVTVKNPESMHTHLNQTMKASIKSTGEIIGMVLVETVVMRSLKMGSLVKTGKYGSVNPSSLYIFCRFC